MSLTFLFFFPLSPSTQNEKEKNATYINIHIRRPRNIIILRRYACRTIIIIHYYVGVFCSRVTTSRCIIKNVIVSKQIGGGTLSFYLKLARRPIHKTILVYRHVVRDVRRNGLGKFSTPSPSFSVRFRKRSVMA